MQPERKLSCGEPNPITQRGGFLRATAVAGWLLAPLIAAGCYTYVPAESPEPGRQIRASVSEQAAAAVTDRLGPGVLEIDGLVLSNENDELSVLIESYLTRRQGLLSGGGEAIRFPRSQLSAVEERRIDGLKSVLLGVAVAGGAATLFTIFGPGGRIYEDKDEPDPGPQDLVAGVRFGPFVMGVARSRSP
jgi:hypothetical protein